MLARFFLLLFISVFALACSSGDDSDNQPDASDDAADAADECADRADGTPCGLDRICLDGACHDSVCGDGYVDALRDEECDDGNFTDGDGCDADCTLSCHTDEDCQDDTICNGTEACIEVPNGKACQMGTPIDCAPTDGSASPCTIYVCHPVDGCDPANFENAITCYADLDDDEYPDPDVTSDFTMGSECDCPEGFIRKRQDDLWDCNDANENAHPGQTSYFALPHCADGSTPTASGSSPCPGVPSANCITYTCEDGSENHSYDYDCNGENTLRLTNRVQCSGLGACNGEGWRFDIPPCGATSAWDVCVNMLLSCGANTSQRSQLCR